MATGLPNSIEVKAEEISEALVEPLNRIIETIRSTLEKSPPEIAADIMETGMVLTGGGALLKNIDLLISKITNMPVHVADEPLTCVAKGTGQELERIKLLKRIAIIYKITKFSLLNQRDIVKLIPNQLKGLLALIVVNSYNYQRTLAQTGLE